MNDYPSLPSESDPVLGREGSPWGYAQLAADALAPSNLSSFYRDRIAPVFGSEDNAPGTKVKPPKGSVLDPQESALRESIQPATANDFDRVVQVITKHGVFPQDPRFLRFLGATAEQNDMTPSARLGPLAGIRDWLFPDAVKLQKRQAALKNIGMLVFQDLAARQLEALHGPQTMRDANAIAPGAVQPNPDQIIEAPRRGDMADAEGPMPGIVDPNAGLTLNQQTQLQPILKGITGGHLMPDETGKIVPTSYNTSVQMSQGRALPPEVVAWMDRAVTTPLGQPLPEAPRSLPAGIYDTVVRERNKRQMQSEKPIDLNNALESLATVESAKRYGVPLSFKEIAAKDSLFAQQLRNQAEIAEKKDIYSFQQDEQLKRTIAAAYPTARAHAEAAQDSPVADPQLWRDLVSGQAADPQITERQARTAKMVKLRPDQVETFNQLSTIDDGLETIKELARGLFSPDAKSVGGNVLRVGGQRAYLAYLRTVGDERVTLLDSIVSRLTAPLVKSQGDTANIAVAERELFAKALINNNASLEAILTNLDNLVGMTRKTRGLMGFKTREEFVQGLINQGMTEPEILKVLKEKGI